MDQVGPGHRRHIQERLRDVVWEEEGNGKKFFILGDNGELRAQSFLSSRERMPGFFEHLCNC